MSIPATEQQAEFAAYCRTHGLSPTQVAIARGEEVKRLREALEFYADNQGLPQDNFYPYYCNHEYAEFGKVINDEGEIARNALKGE